MPFKSMAQSRFMFSQHPQMAKEWASKTDYSNLPNKVSDNERKKQAIRNNLKGGK